MAELPLTENDQASETARSSRLWLVKIIGLSLGIAVAIVAFGVIAITALVTPSSRSATAAVNASSGQPANGASTSSTSALTDTTTSADSPLPIATPLPTDTPMPMATAAPLETLLPTATSTPVPIPSPTATQRVTFRSSSSNPRISVATRTPQAPPEPLSFSFYYRAYCHRYDDNLQVIDLFITGHGGQPPYDYYNDTTQFGAHTSGLERLTVKTSSGNPVPFKIIIVDSKGQSYMENFFLKTKVRCVNR
jgi:hypothetical protein